MKRKSHRLNERGAVLIAGLLILVVLSILGVTTMQSSLLQERMVGNLEQKDLAFQMAEAGLRDAENFILTTALLPASFNGTAGLYTPAAAGDQPHWNSIDWNNVEQYRVYSANDDVADLPELQRPRYIIELLASVSGEADEDASQAYGPDDGTGARVYRITSRGLSPNGRAVVMLQTTYLHQL